jgi:hypothetical protein
MRRRASNGTVTIKHVEVHHRCGDERRSKGGKEAAREVKLDARWAKMFEKQEVKIDLLKNNVAAIKRKEDPALLTADTSSMCVEVKAWHKAQCDIILAEMRPPPMSSTTTVAIASSTTMPAMTNPPEAPDGVAPTDVVDVKVEEVFHI